MIREFFITANGVQADWLIFLGILLLVCIAVGLFVVWATVFRNRGKKRRKRRHRHHHDRKQPGSPLSAGGGLPPRREPPPDSPPPAP
jgi:ABC-type nickel/cobalt efflux system permease component RcnA